MLGSLLLRLHRSFSRYSVFVVAATLGLAALAKAIALPQLVATLDGSMLMPPYLAMPAALILVAWEVVLTFGLMLPVSRGGSLWCSAATLSGFIGFAVWRSVAGLPVPCSCFGPLFAAPPAASAAICLALLLCVYTGLVQVPAFAVEST
jgi:hypothetical protein